MVDNKIIVLAIIASFVVFEHGRVCTADEFTLNQYIGVWYVMGMTAKITDDIPVSCAWFNATKLSDENQSLIEDNHVIMMIESVPRSITIRAYGKFIGSEMSLRWPEYDVKSVFTFSSHGNANEIIGHSKNDKFDNQLLSRNQTVSKEMHTKFRLLAASMGARIITVSHKNCSYDHHNEY